MMVTVALLFAKVAPVGALKATKKVSVASARVSPTTCRVTVFVVSPGANVTVP